MTQAENQPLIQIARKSEIINYNRDEAKPDKRKPLMCSRCGLCYTSYRTQLADACVFVENRYEALEVKLHGRNRHADTDEDMFGVFRRMYVARMKQALPNAQWSGMVTSLATLLLEKKLVDGVICVQNKPDTRFAPLPTLATTVEELQKSAGNKPCLSHNLSALEQAKELGVKRLAYIGNGCQTHALRAIQDTLPFEKVYSIGLPCTDIVSYQNLMKFLGLISSSAETIVHMEFMPDYRVWMRHEDGHVEKVGYFELPMDKMDANIFPDSCMSCFDYTNSLSDITIGYLGAKMPYQWVLVRTAVGEELFELLRPYLEFGNITQSGDHNRTVAAYLPMLEKPRKLPKWGAKLLGFVVRHRGLKGVEFARGTLTMKWARNLHFIRKNYPEHEDKLVPEFAKRVLKKHGM
jgi:coenzyme F420-reducing hydrogenase beta subunit